MRYFTKGFLIGTLCICLLGLVWLFAFQPRLTAAEAQDLKTQFTTIPEDDLSGDGPAGKEETQLDFEAVPFPVSWTVKMKKKQKETQDILSYHTQAAGCSDKARAKASGGRQPIEECGRTGL